MPVYIPLHNAPLQYMDTNGDPLASGTLEFFLSGTSTPTNLFSDNAGTSIGTSITLNSEGYPESGGNVITLFRDTAINYKIVGKNASAVEKWTADTLTTTLAVLGTTANGEGAALIGLEDSGGNYTATDVEAAFAELASTSTGEGASIIGVEDSAGVYTGTTVEAVLAELIATGSFTATFSSGFTTTPTVTFNYTKIGRVVTIHADGTLAATSDTTTLQCDSGDVPAAIRPTETVVTGVWGIEDNGSHAAGTIKVTNAGQLTWSSDQANGSFTAGGDKGFIGSQCFTYLVD